MNLIFRLLWMAICAPFRGKQALTDACVLRFRVWPTDLDLNRHMTNSRYLALMDLGRIDMLLASGLLGQIVKRRWGPVVSVANIRFKRSLSPLQKFELHTRLIAWDEKWFYIEQKFVSDSRIVAAALVKGLFKEGKSNVPVKDILDLSGESVASTCVTDQALSLDRLEADLRLQE